MSVLELAKSLNKVLNNSINCSNCWLVFRSGWFTAGLYNEPISTFLLRSEILMNNVSKIRSTNIDEAMLSE